MNSIYPILIIILVETFDIKMKLSIIDSFSPKAMIYRLNNKKSQNIIKNTLEFYIYNEISKGIF